MPTQDTRPAERPAEPTHEVDPSHLPETSAPESRFTHFRRLIVGGPKDLGDRSIFHRLALVPFLAWVGLGADGLSSSSYGPDEAFRTLGEHTYLAVGLAAMTALTIFVISAAYSRIIEQFPHGGGGYVVATKLLGQRVGLVSGCALLVDYVLTITVSIVAAGDALFSFLPMEWQGGKLAFDVVLILVLTTLNLRGVRESVVALTPIFLIFLVTHVVLIGGGIIAHAPRLAATASNVGSGFHSGLGALGVGGMMLLFFHAYSLGGGTYTGLEAVSNGLPIMREPRVRTGKRTMLYMASSLAFTAAGLLLCYLLWNVSHVEGKTLNAVLLERTTAGLPFGHTFLVLTLISEGALLVVGAQAGFIDGPRVLGNLAVDSWVPHRFASLSERLTIDNGILLMAAGSLAVFIYTHGDIRHLVVMYSINVFLTFSLSMLSMLRFWIGQRTRERHWRRSALLFTVGLLLCATILVIAVVEKFTEGGWVTLVVTGGLVIFCFRMRRHYRLVYSKLEQLYRELGNIPLSHPAEALPLEPSKPTAAVLVASFSGLGIHTALNAFRAFPGHFKNVVFLSVGVVDSGEFKGEDAVDALRERTENMLQKYVDLAAGMGVAATYRMAMGTDAVDVSEKLCLAVAEEFPQITYFAGKIIFGREKWYQPLLHNETAFAVQKRLQWAGRTMVVIPARVK